MRAAKRTQAMRTPAKAVKRGASGAKPKVQKRAATRVRPKAQKRAASPARAGALKRTARAATTGRVSDLTLQAEPARERPTPRDALPQSAMTMGAQLISRHQEYARAVTAQWWRLWTAPLRLAGASRLGANASRNTEGEKR
jgi:hypothetical protein